MEFKMKQTLKYIQDTLGIQATAIPLAKSYLDKLPMYITETYKVYKTELFNSEIILALLKTNEELSIQKTEKTINQIKSILHNKVVIVLENIQAYNRKRLIDIFFN